MMKAVFRSICVFLLVLCVSPLRAETITHNFDNMLRVESNILFSKYNPSALANSVANTDELKYSCGTSGASFGLDKIYKAVVALNIPSDGKVITSPAIEDLTQVRIYYYTASSYAPESLEIKVSTDGIFNGDALTIDALSKTYDDNGNPKKAAINCIYDLPKGNYYIEITNSASDVSIFQIEYKTDPSSCACLQVVSQ